MTRLPLNLNPGDNERLVAVTGYNAGWAFECEVDPVQSLPKNMALKLLRKSVSDNFSILAYGL